MNGDEMIEFNLTSIFTEKTVRARVEASSWEDSVDQVGKMLEEAGKIEPGYTEAMKNTIRELGAYSVIAPGIAMPHARPEDGVREPCFALITLSTPVNFGNPENDPVDIVVAFGATDKEKHVQVLSQIAELFGDDEAVQKIRGAQSDGELLELLGSSVEQD
jgi:mannitol/fructose-specific phosphotransferase system IIA component (Ntr-type)